ncbi:hypothetical protein WJX72_004981 [[Myrmecia] bisecta]|uniref:Uncharacterized protein n=1 Tax=[Myrmecia] bisecta TaxID=41462 RepID=A0AAW1PW56_9CHLO
MYVLFASSDTWDSSFGHIDTRRRTSPAAFGKRQQKNPDCKRLAGAGRLVSDLLERANGLGPPQPVLDPHNQTQTSDNESASAATAFRPDPETSTALFNARKDLAVKRIAAERGITYQEALLVWAERAKKVLAPGLAKLAKYTKIKQSG